VLVPEPGLAPVLALALEPGPVLPALALEPGLEPGLVQQLFRHRRTVEAPPAELQLILQSSSVLSSFPLLCYLTQA